MTRLVQQSLTALIADFELLILEMEKEALRRASVCHEWERRCLRVVERFCNVIEPIRGLGDMPGALVLLLKPVTAKLRQFWLYSRREFRCLGDEAAHPAPTGSEQRFMSLLPKSQVRDDTTLGRRVDAALSRVRAEAEKALKRFRTALGPITDFKS